MGERLTFLQNKLKQFKDKFYKDLEKRKHKKFKKLSPSLSEIWNTQNQWIPDLNLTNQDRLNIRNKEEIDDFIILQAMNLLQKQYPTITTQPPSLAFSTGYSYCPSETVQITHTGAHHWVLLSSMYSKTAIYDSLNLQPTDFLLNQIWQLFSCDNSMPNFEQIKCYEQVGSTDCGLFAIAYAADILNGNNIYDLIYAQTKMREHLIACFEQRKITTFPLYEKRNTEKVVTYKKTSSPWNKLRGSARLRSKATQNFTHKIKLSNRFETKEADLQKKDLNKSIEVTSKAVGNKMKTTDTICNISSTKLSESEISLLNKELNFCPSTKEPNKEQLLDDLYFFCQKLKLKEYF